MSGWGADVVSSHEGTHKGCPYGERGRLAAFWGCGPGWGRWLVCAGAHSERATRRGEGEVWSQRVDKVILPLAGCGGGFRGGVAGAEPPHKGGPNRPDRPKARRE